MPLRIVYVEDDVNDRELVAEILRADGIDCTLEAVGSRDAFERALEREPDLVLSDFSMPDFDGATAQRLSLERWPDAPFVFVSGSIGEERAVESLKNGATDYVLKHHLEKLPTAVRRALKEADNRRQRTAAEEALRQLNAELERRVEERTAALQAANEALRRARVEADRANHAKSEFLSRMSHDLRTPLNAIMGFAEVVQFDPLTPEQAEGVAHIIRGGQHLLQLINEVLDIARIEAGHLTLSLEPVSVGDALGDAVGLIKPLADQRAISVAVDVPRDVQALADRQRLCQVLLNLLSNAVKYNRPQGVIQVTARCAGGTAVIDISDTGSGIPPDKLSLLFKPFERLGAEQSGIEGTGLGLALARRLTEAMHGSLTVESVVNAGTTFQVRLPASERAPGTGEARPARGATVPQGRGTVLYVEDNASNAHLMSRILSRRPAIVLTHAPDGRTAIERLAAQPPDLVILDLHLFDMSGEEVLRHIRNNAATRRIPVVVLSADATAATRDRLFASGASRFVTKPFAVSAVLQTIDEVLTDA